MHEVKKAKAADIFAVVSEVLAMEKSARIAVTGTSMLPFLRDGQDSVELSEASFAELKVGDIVLIKRLSGQYVLHRIILKDHDRFFMMGDAQQWTEGPLYPSQLVAVVTAAWRGDRRIDCSHLLWRFSGALWLRLKPIRPYILRVYMKTSGLLRKLM